MSAIRLRKIESMILREISTMIQTGEVKDPRIGFVTLTKVNVTKDLKEARVYVTVLGDIKAKRDTFVGLKNATGFMQGKLGDVLKMRFCPILIFKEDESFQHSQHINEVLKRIHEEKPYLEEAEDKKDARK